jgi:DNA repair exonuclease SbcCD ATPase subunit
MANDSMADAEKRDPQPSNSITVGAIGLAVLIIIIVAVTSLLNNKKISALETRSSQLEARLQILQEETAVSVKKQVDVALLGLSSANMTSPEQAQTVAEEATIEPPKVQASQTTALVALVEEQNDKFKGVEAQLQTLKGEIMTARYQLNEQIKAQKRQTAQLVTTLRADMIALAQKQNDKLKGVEAQLETSNGETTEALKQHNEQLKALGSQVTQLETALKADMVALAQEQNDKLNGLTGQLETLRGETTSSFKQQNVQAEQLADQVTQVKADMATQNETFKVVEAQLQSLTKENAATDKQKNEQIEQLSRQLDHQVSEVKTALKADMVTLAQEQDDKLKGLEAQLQTLKGETMTALYQENVQVKAVERQVTQLETSLKADGVALAQAQNDKLKELEAQLQSVTEETTSHVNQQASQLETALKGEIVALANEQNGKLNGLTTQLQALSEETTSSQKQQNEQFEQLGQQVSQLKADMAALSDEQSDKLKAVEAQLETMSGETRAVLNQQDEQLKALASQATSLVVDMESHQQAQNDKFNGLTIQLQSVTEETSASINQLSQQAIQLETALKADMAILAQEQNDKLEAQLQTLRGETISPAEPLTPEVSQEAQPQEQSDKVEAQIDQTEQLTEE